MRGYGSDLHVFPGGFYGVAPAGGPFPLEIEAAGRSETKATRL